MCKLQSYLGKCNIQQPQFSHNLDKAVHNFYKWTSCIATYGVLGVLFYISDSLYKRFV